MFETVRRIPTEAEAKARPVLTASPWGIEEYGDPARAAEDASIPSPYADRWRIEVRTTASYVWEGEGKCPVPEEEVRVVDDIETAASAHDPWAVKALVLETDAIVAPDKYQLRPEVPSWLPEIQPLPHLYLGTAWCLEVMEHGHSRAVEDSESVGPYKAAAAWSRQVTNAARHTGVIPEDAVVIPVRLYYYLDQHGERTVVRYHSSHPLALWEDEAEGA